MSLRICAITTWPPYREGIAIYSAKLYIQIANYAQVIVVANKLNSKKDSDEFKQKNLKLWRFWRKGHPFCLIQILKGAVRSRADIFHLQFGWFLYGGPLTICFFPFLVFFLRLSQRPIIITLHSVIRRNAEFSDNKLFNYVIDKGILAITKLLVAFSSKTIVHNALMKKALKENYRCDENKIVIIPHGVEKAGIKEKNERDNSGRDINIVSLGFIRKSKGLESLIKAFLKLHVDYPNSNLILVGGKHPHDSDSYFETLQKTVKDKGDQFNIFLTNFVTEKELDNIIRKASIIVLLSKETKFLEASGALARISDFNKPVVCSKIPKFLGEFGRKPNCCIMIDHDPEEIYNAMKRLLENSELRSRISLNLKRFCRERYWNCVAEKHMKLYRNLT